MRATTNFFKACGLAIGGIQSKPGRLTSTELTLGKSDQTGLGLSNRGLCLAELDCP